jgi:glycerophosphoryl diester phosphodiesterase
MIKANFNAYASYVTDSLHQWDLNQVLQVSGLNLATVPEVHFSNANTDRAIVRQATMANHVVSVGVPNSLLQEPLRIYAHIGIYEGDTFKVVELVEIPVKPRKRPADYQIQDADEEIYSFKALENALANRATKAEAETLRTGINARIDRIIAHNNDTDGNSELVDARTDLDGKEHGSAGTAVREQVLDLRRHHVKPNLIDLDKLSAGYLTDADNVTLGPMAEDCYHSDYIPVNSALPYYLSVNNKLSFTTQWLAVSTYDSEKNLIKRISEYTGARKFDFAENVAFVRVSFRGLYLHDVKFEQSAYQTIAAEKETSPNLHDLYPLTLPGYVDSPGTIHVPTQEGYTAPGVVANEKYSRFLPVTPGEVYVFYNGAKKYPWAAVGFYSETGHFINRVPFTTGANGCTEIVVPDGAVAMRYSARTYTQTAFVVYKKTGLNDYMDAYVEALIAENAAPIDPHHPVKAVAHRGYSTEAPENTLPAYRLAKKNGFNYAECDVSFTSDGVAVLLHDSTIDRTSNGGGSISEMDFDTVRAMDFGSWKAEAYAGTTIPTFEEFIALCRAIGLRPYVELKAGTQAQIESLVDTVTRYGMREETTWISFTASYLSHVKAKDDRARLGLTADAVTADTITAAQGLRTDHNEVFIDCSAANSLAAVDLCSAAQLPLEVWTVNNEDTIKALDPYVSGVTSDNLVAGRVLYAANID